jgi:hypothetical protein
VLTWRTWIIQLAQKYGRTPAQLILCHTICRGISVIPRTNTPKRIVENFEVLFELADEDFEVIANLMGERGERGVRNLETRNYLGFDNFNEVTEEPWRWRLVAISRYLSAFLLYQRSNE